MSKCPICGGDMIAGGICHYNLDCPIHDQNVPTEVLELLDRTRKALDVAVDALKKYKADSGNWWYGYEFQGHYEDCAGEHADKALEQITALEQKD